MDLNQLYFDHQIALMRAAEAPHGDAASFSDTADGIAREIACVQHHLGACA